MIVQRCNKLLLALFLSVVIQPWQAAIGQSALLDIMKSELDREYSALQKEEVPPYFISYMVTDVYETTISASFGVLTESNTTQKRLLTVSVRVGDYTMDNTREIRGDMFAGVFDRIPGFNLFPIDDSRERAIRQELWKETNNNFRKAIQRYAKVKSNVAVKVEAEDQSDDFSKIANPPQYIASPIDIDRVAPDVSAWEAKLKNYSRPFLEYKDIMTGDATFKFNIEIKYFVTSEGAKIRDNRIMTKLYLNSMVKADDGMELPLYRSYSSFTPEDLPSDNSITADANTMVSTLKKLKDAPVVDPYTGPAILSGRAAGVFFHEIFGHRIEGHRQKSESEGQTFKKKINEKVLPDFVSVYCDPSIKEYEGTKLMGYYEFDDEGVRGERVDIVTDGIFRNFLMSRVPIQNFPKSNGHGRAEAGYKPISRQSNLIVETKKPESFEKLRKQLIEECKKQNKEYGLLFEDIQGGFTITGRTLPNAFNVTPTEVYRIYTDGRPDELVRGVDLVGTPLVMFSNIEATGDKNEIFNGTCGAESGGVPVSAVSPALLVSQIEVQKKEKSQERPALLPRPDTDPENTHQSQKKF